MLFFCMVITIVCTNYPNVMIIVCTNYYYASNSFCKLFLFNCKWKTNVLTSKERKIRMCVFLYNVKVNSNHNVKGKNIFIWSPLFLQNQPKDSEAVAQRCSVKNVFLQISQNSQENTCPRVSFLIKLQASGIQLC